jgi:hypothetical protein
MEPVRAQVFAGIPGAVAGRLEADIPVLIREIVDSLGDSQPDYAAYLDADSDDVIALAQEALRLLVTMAGTGQELVEQLPQATFEEVGRLEFEAGRSLRDLLSAYRIGARVAWRYMARVSIEQGAGAELLAALAEAVFAFVDALSDATARGYARAQSVAGAERERRRFALAELLLSGTADPAAVEELATAAGWRAPASLALVLVAQPVGGETALTLADRLGPGALPVVRGEELTGALAPGLDSRGGRARAAARLRGYHAVVGLPATPAALAARVARTERALRLLGQGVLPDDDPAFVEDHLAAVVVHRDPVLAAEVGRRRLAALAPLPAATQARLRETLRAWLDHLGDRRATAEALRVHPQTVRYRMDQLNRLLGPDLGGAEIRFELALALRASENRG